MEDNIVNYLHDLAGQKNIRGMKNLLFEDLLAEDTPRDKALKLHLLFLYSSIISEFGRFGYTQRTQQKKKCVEDIVVCSQKIVSIILDRCLQRKHLQLLIQNTAKFLTVIMCERKLSHEEWLGIIRKNAIGCVTMAAVVYAALSHDDSHKDYMPVIPPSHLDLKKAIDLLFIKKSVAEKYLSLLWSRPYDNAPPILGNSALQTLKGLDPDVMVAVQVKTGKKGSGIKRVNLDNIHKNHQKACNCDYCRLHKRMDSGLPGVRKVLCSLPAELGYKILSNHAGS